MIWMCLENVDLLIRTANIDCGSRKGKKGSRAPRREVSTIEGARQRAKVLPGSREQFKRDTGALATWAI